MNSTRFRILLLSIMLLTISSVTAYADGVERVQHNKNFVLSSRKIYVKSSDIVTQRLIQEKLFLEGAILVDDLFSRIISPRVVVGYHESVEGSNEAFSITVRSRKVSIKFTSQEMLDAALEEFNGLFSQSGANKIIKGCDITLKGGESLDSDFEVNSLGVFDGITQQISSQDIEHEIKQRTKKRHRDSKFILALGNRDVYRVDFDALDGINPKMSSLSEGWKYSKEELRGYVNYARSCGCEFVPAIDFLSQNERFEECTGHKIDSPEGMRFVRAMIEEAAREWGIKYMCVGTSSKISVAPYMLEFLQSVAKRVDLELIVL